jgi:hypothetical protein
MRSRPSTSALTSGKLRLSESTSTTKKLAFLSCAMTCPDAANSASSVLLSRVSSLFNVTGSVNVFPATKRLSFDGGLACLPFKAKGRKKRILGEPIRHQKLAPTSSVCGVPKVRKTSWSVRSRVHSRSCAFPCDAMRSVDTKPAMICFLTIWQNCFGQKDVDSPQSYIRNHGAGAFISIIFQQQAMLDLGRCQA